MSKHGFEYFSFEVIATAKTQEDINILEGIVIDQYNSTDLTMGYNLESGGGGFPRSPETGAKISAALKEYYKDNPTWSQGKKMTDEFCKAVSEGSMGKAGTNTGKTFDDEWREGLSQSQAGRERFDNRRFTKEEEENICNLYIGGISTDKISNKIKVGKSLVLSVLKRNNIIMRSYGNGASAANGKVRSLFTPEKEREIVEEYKNTNISRIALAEKYKCGKTTMRNILLRNGVSLKK
jgi:transposase